MPLAGKVCGKERSGRWKRNVSMADVVLYAEDNENDAILMGCAFKKARPAGVLISVHNGEEALKYLRGEGSYGDRRKYPLPGLLLTDLNMPGTDGYGLLSELKNLPADARPPAVVLTSSGIGDDKARALGLGAAGYYVKPGCQPELVRILDEISELWLSSEDF